MLNKIYRTMTDLPQGKQGLQAVVRDGPGVSMYIYIDGKWWKYSNAYPAGTKSNSVVTPRGAKLPKAVFDTIELKGRPKKENEIGFTKSSSFLTPIGKLGNTILNFQGYARVGTATDNWVFFNTSGSGAYTTSNSDTSVGSTVVLSHATTLSSHYKTTSILSPYKLSVFAFSVSFGDTIGLSSGGYQRFGLWTSPIGSTANAITNTGTGDQTYTLKLAQHAGGTISAGTMNYIYVVDPSKDTNVTINAGDYIQIGMLNTEYTSGSSKYYQYNLTLYCKYI